MPLRYDAGFDDRPMETPILVPLFRAVGVVVLLASALLTVAVFQTQQSIVNIPVAAVVAAGGVLVSLVPFGFAPVILLVAKIEYHTAAQKDAAILQLPHKIEGISKPPVPPRRTVRHDPFRKPCGGDHPGVEDERQGRAGVDHQPPRRAAEFRRDVQPAGASGLERDDDRMRRQDDVRRSLVRGPRGAVIRVGRARAAERGEEEQKWKEGAGRRHRPGAWDGESRSAVPQATPVLMELEAKVALGAKERASANHRRG